MLMGCASQRMLLYVLQSINRSVAPSIRRIGS